VALRGGETMSDESKNGAVLVVAAHPDDEVLGCGATLARLSRAGHSVHVLLMADGESSRSKIGGADGGDAAVTARREAARRAAEILGCASVTTLAMPDNRMDRLEMLDVVQQIEECMLVHRPTIVFTHHSGDVNVDHRVVHEAVIAACRPQPDHHVRRLLFFEVPSSTEWRPAGSGRAFCPNYFVDVTAVLPRKLEALDAYRSELRPFPHPRSREAITALAQWRGATVGVESAEAFMLGRELL
jgi:N-acetylglucosamine malate deacetylase 1